MRCQVILTSWLNVNVILRPFGVKMLELILEYAQAKSNNVIYTEASDVAEVAFGFVQDLTLTFLQYSKHNQEINKSEHFTTTCNGLVRNGFYTHQFCSSCKKFDCDTNQYMACIVMVSMYYLTKVVNMFDFFKLIIY